MCALVCGLIVRVATSVRVPLSISQRTPRRLPGPRACASLATLVLDGTCSPPRRSRISPRAWTSCSATTTLRRAVSALRPASCARTPNSVVLARVAHLNDCLLLLPLGPVLGASVISTPTITKTTRSTRTPRTPRTPRMTKLLPTAMMTTTSRTRTMTTTSRTMMTMMRPARAVRPVRSSPHRALSWAAPVVLAAMTVMVTLRWLRCRAVRRPVSAIRQHLGCSPT
mmetsp:Transcript_6374/g.19294  ORF Transcript_6374/g.19294 Transcript_6374/m.19294 type:complete len:226 (-) Transcript_6374:465-1142(-)